MSGEAVRKVPEAVVVERRPADTVLHVGESAVTAPANYLVRVVLLNS